MLEREEAAVTEPSACFEVGASCVGQFLTCIKLSQHYVTMMVREYLNYFSNRSIIYLIEY